MSWIADYDTHGREFPTCVHVTKTAGDMTHGATYVPIEDGRAVRVENAKLTKLARWMYQVMDESCAVHYPYEPAPVSMQALMRAEKELQALGIEVPE